MKKLILILPLFVVFFCFQSASAADLTVPFSSQAPMSDWSQPWFDACEETSILMVDQYYAKDTLYPEKSRDQILEIFRIKNNYYGHSLDEEADKMVSLIDNFFPWEAYKVYRPNLIQIKRELDQGHPIIMPADGKALNNPNFLSGGPDYHVIVISGYDDAKREFITQDPGTHLGKNYRYSYSTIMSAMHDFLPNNQTPLGEQVLVFTRPNIIISANFDGDKDGLVKADELKHRTILYFSDSDGDGISDGDEVKNGFSPIINQERIPNNRLVKTVDQSPIYLIENNKKRYVTSIAALIRLSRDYGQVVNVGNALLNSLTRGLDIN